MPKITIEIDVTEKQFDSINETAISEGYENVQEWWQERFSLEVRETLRRKNMQVRYEADARTVLTKEQILTDRLDRLTDVFSKWIEKVNQKASTCNGNCGMNYCDDNGCIDRKRAFIDPELIAKA